MVAVSALLLTAVVSTKGKTSVALAAHHLIAVVLLGQSSQGGLYHSSSNLEKHFQSFISLQVVGLQCLAVVQLLSSENKALVVDVHVFSLLEHLFDRLHGFSALHL